LAIELGVDDLLVGLVLSGGTKDVVEGHGAHRGSGEKAAPEQEFYLDQ